MTANKRETQKRATRAAILETASEEFDAKGYAGTAISDIADRLSLTKGSVYFHFPSKALLASELVEGYFVAWEPLLAEVEARGLTGFDAIRWTATQVSIRYRDDVAIRAALRLMREAALIETDLPTPFVGWMEHVRRWLDQARGAGQLRPGLDPEAVAWHIVATFHGTHEVAHRLDQRQDLEQKVEAFWSLLLPGILTADALAARP